MPLALSVPAIEACAVVLYAAPLGGFLAARASRGASLARLGLDVPCFVALDLLSIVLLACVVPLEVAVLISRPAWLLGGAAWLLAGRGPGRAGPPRVPAALSPGAVATVLCSTALAVAVSAAVSRRYLLWDRSWHSPQVCAIGPQSIPFVNVLEPGAPWRYHYAADVLAAVFRTLSLDTMSANRALSLAHDASFGLTAMSLSLLLLGLGHRPGPVPALGGAAVLLSGPIPLHGTRLTAPMFGFMYPNFLSNSFRPHVALAGLLLVGFVGSVVANALEAPGRSQARAPLPLLAIAALLSLTDEVSLAVLVPALGLAWLVDPSVLGAGRRRGVAVLLALAAVSVLPSVTLGGSFAAGGAVQKLGWVAGQVPSFDGQVLPWSSAGALRVLACDLLPLLLGGAGILLVAARRPSRGLAALALFAVAVCAACTVSATHFQVNGQSAGEVERFFVAPFFAVLVIALVLLPRAPRGSGRGLLLAAGVAVPAVFSVVWLLVVLPERLWREKVGSDPATEGAYDVDCRREAGASLGDRPVPTYVPTADYFLFTSCRAVFSAGLADPQWPTKIYPYRDGAAELRALDAEVSPPGAAVSAACRADGGDGKDPVCRRLLARPGGCQREGERYVRCVLGAGDRDVLLGRGGE
jgi:hypothetical protein